MKKITAVITLALLIMSGCNTTDSADEGTVEYTETTIVQESDEPNLGGWTDQSADIPELLEAFKYFQSWIKSNPDLMIGADSAVLTGGATQVVAGLNLRLFLENTAEWNKPLIVHLYQDFSGGYEIWKIESSGEIIYE